ncbi:unnamed protein product, partial [Allacma fusca]
CTTKIALVQRTRSADVEIVLWFLDYTYAMDGVECPQPGF